jgi:la-related protein 1
MYTNFDREYYFSVDNLCKDMFLRRHMDSQGFVLLTFIASFKRIKNLNEDFEFLRQCCRQLRNVEYHFGEDGYDRLRPRDTWEQWVLPVDQRDQSAQNEGPSAPNFHYSKPHDRHDDHATSPHNGIMPFANGFGPGNIQTTNGFPNGTADHEMPRTSLSSTAPEFTPLAPAEIQNESSNVGAFYGS